jgi:hypothetical protein
MIQQIVAICGEPAMIRQQRNTWYKWYCNKCGKRGKTTRREFQCCDIGYTRITVDDDE